MIKVGVFFGGKSIEREVSFNSGRTVCDHLDNHLYKIIPIFQHQTGQLYILPWSFLHRGKIADFAHRLDTQATKIYWDDLPKLIDFAYIALHGKYAEDGKMQAILELFQIPYLGTKIFGSSLGINKIIQNRFLHMHNIMTPKGFGLSIKEVLTATNEMILAKMKTANINFPLIVKPQAEGSSIGIYVIKNTKNLITLLHKSCFSTSKIGQDIMIEEKIIGMEFNQILITDPSTQEMIALPPTEIILKPGCDIFDYHHKYMPGAANKKTPASCSQENIQRIQQTCLQVAKALEFKTTARIDGFLKENGDIIILDSNPISGMAPSSFLFRQAAQVGINHSMLINMLIKSELKNYHMDTIIDKKDEKVMTKKRIAVLLAGASNERETSLDSGRNVCYKLSAHKYEIIPIFVDQHMKLHLLNEKLLVCTSTNEISKLLHEATPITWSELKTKADFVFIALHGGAGENGTVQGSLEMLAIPYNGPSVFTSALCMDKYKTNTYLKAMGFNVPDSLLLSKKDFQAQYFDHLNLFFKKHHKIIVKPHDDGCSVLVFAPKTKTELFDALTQIFTQKDFALLEERIEGTELTVGVIGNDNPQAFVPSQSIAKGSILTSEEKFLPGAGENQTPACITQDAIELVQQTIRDVFIAVKGCGYSRIDCFYQTAEQSPTKYPRVVILEINTLPALTPATCLFHQAAEHGLQPAELLDTIIELGFQAHQPEEIFSVDYALAKQNEEL